MCTWALLGTFNFPHEIMTDANYISIEISINFLNDASTVKKQRYKITIKNLKLLNTDWRCIMFLV